MGQRSRDDLDAALIPQPGVEGDHLGDDPKMLGQYNGLVFLGEALALRDQGSEGFLREEAGIGPGEVEEHLQIAQVIGTESRVAGFRQLQESGKAGDDLRVDVEEPRPR